MIPSKLCISTYFQPYTTSNLTPVFQQYASDSGKAGRFFAGKVKKTPSLFHIQEGLASAPHRRFPYDAAEARVRSAAKHLFDEGDVDAFVYALESFIEKEVWAAANIAVAENVEAANS